MRRQQAAQRGTAAHPTCLPWRPPFPGWPAEQARRQESAAQAGTSGSSVTDTLTRLVKTEDFSPLFLGGAFLLSLVLGSLHALTPGHGKALVGAYLVGSQGRTRDAVFLGSIVTITHTGSVVLLGLVTLFASHYILPALLAPWLEIISGVLVIGFGLESPVSARRRSEDDGCGEALRRIGEHEHSHDHGMGTITGMSIIMSITRPGNTITNTRRKASRCGHC